MKYTALPLLTVIALSACATTAAPNTPGNPDGADDVVINQTAGLSAYPGAGGSETVPEGLDSRTSFNTDASLEEVYGYFNGELVDQGWQQTSIETEDDEIEAEYVRDGRELEFELERDDGRYELEIDVDGDNTGYDEDNGAGDDDDDSDDGDDDDGSDG